MTAATGRQLCARLEGRGWVLVRVAGVHHVYRHPTDGRLVTVMARGSRLAKPGTRRRLADAAGPAPAEL